MAELYSYTIDQYQVFEDIIKSRVERVPQIRFDLIIDGSIIMTKGNYDQLQAKILEHFQEHNKRFRVLEYNNENGKKAIIEYNVERPTSKIIASRFVGKSTGGEHEQSLEGILDEKLEHYRKEMEHKQLQEKHNELERRYKSLKSKYKSKVDEYDQAVDAYEKELEEIKSQTAELQKQASIGNQVFEGIKTAVPVLIQQKPVQNFLNGLAASQGIEEVSDHVSKQPTPQEDDEFSEEDWEYMNLILDVKEEVKEKFQMVTVLLEMFIKDPSKIDEVINFLTSNQ